MPPDVRECGAGVLIAARGHEPDHVLCLAPPVDVVVDAARAVRTHLRRHGDPALEAFGTHLTDLDHHPNDTSPLVRGGCRSTLALFPRRWRFSCVRLP